MKSYHFIISFAFFFSSAVFSQKTIVSGKVTDANTGDPIPFANIIFNGHSTGTTTNFSGFYNLQIGLDVDSIVCSIVGYKKVVKAVVNKKTQVIDFQLTEEVYNLKEVVFYAGENPAFEIIREVINRKKINDKRNLDAYEYETYAKVEIDVDNISEKFRNKKFMKKIVNVMDSIEQIAGEDGKPILPVFLSETLSKYYFKNNPKTTHEKIIKSKISGVGVDDGSMSAQFIGSTFQNYNFYEDWLHIAGKDFISPVSDTWKFYYNYELIDSLFVGNDFCYKIEFFPKREQDLAFFGNFWITKNEFALKQIDATIKKSANLNYIEKIRIQQELIKTEAGAWLSSKNRVLLDIGEIKDDMAGVLAKFYTSNKNFVVNKPKEQKFYLKQIDLSEDYLSTENDTFWNEARHEPLSSTELNVYRMIDTLTNIPVIKNYIEIINIAVNGYKRVDKIDFGPYFSLYANNVVEGHRFQFGMKTNYNYSKKWVFGGRIAYGTNDQKFKYSIFTDFILSRLHWTYAKIEYRHDIDQLGLAEDDLLGNSVFLTATKFGQLVRPYFYDQYRFILEREIFKGYIQKAQFKYRNFEPLFPFAYYANHKDASQGVETNIQIAEISVESRLTKNEVFIQKENSRFSLGTNKWPILTLKYTRGIAGLFGSDFNYNKIGFSLFKKMKTGIFGTSTFDFTGEHTFENLPYPLYKTHIGNESFFTSTAAYNLMNFSEFVSSTFVELKYNHFFEGYILNRIPLIKKLKWRLVASANILYGYLDPENIKMLPEKNLNDVLIDRIGGLKKNPYTEISYGVENIFKIIRIDFIHRLTYLDNPNVSKFGAKIRLQFVL